MNDKSKPLTPLELSAALKSNRPPRPGKRPRGRPHKDGSPPRQSPQAAAKEIEANEAVKRAMVATTEERAATIGTAESVRSRLTTSNKPPAKYLADDIDERLKRLEETIPASRARAFLRAYAFVGFTEALKASGVSHVMLAGYCQNDDFKRLYHEIRRAHDAATVARTCDTLSSLANGEYKPKPDCLPPDMRAASLLLPALDDRFRSTGQSAAQQVQINISI